MPPKKRHEAKSQAQRSRTRKDDEHAPCPHTCSECKPTYRKGRSGAWAGHVQTKGPRVHSKCTPNCPGNEFLSQPQSASDIPGGTSSLANSIILDSDEKRNRVLTLLWIIDPTSASPDIESTEGQCQWYDISLRAEDKILLQDGNLNGLIFSKPDDEARICEYLDLYRLLPSENYAKSIMPFSEFKKIVLAKTDEKLQKFDVVIPPFITIDLWSTTYGFTDKQASTYLKNLAKLENSGVHFWPTIKECLLQADKVENIRQLDDIATRITTSPRPVTNPLAGIEDIASVEKGVVKRTFSDKSEHVYFLPDDHEKITKSLAKDETRFLWQEFIPSLKTHGELRVGISLGEVIWRVWTVSNGVADDIQYEFCDVTHPKRILNIPMGDLPDDPFDNDYRQIAPIYKQNLLEIDNFALATFRELVRQRAKDLGYEPSHITFARLDLGIMADKNGNAQFFVNEVETLPNVTIWRGDDHAGPIAAAIDHTIYKLTVDRLGSPVESD